MKTEMDIFWERHYALNAQRPRVCENCGVCAGEEIECGTKRKKPKFAVVRAMLRPGALVDKDNVTLLCDKCLSAGMPKKLRRAKKSDTASAQIPLFAETQKA